MFEFSPETLTPLSNGIKDELFRQLERDGVIDDAEYFSAKYVIVAKSKGFFGKAYDNIFGEGKQDDELLVKVLKTDYEREQK